MKRFSHGKSAALIAASVALAAFLPVAGSFASSHREAPLISQDPSADATDLYAFMAPGDSSRIVLVANSNPLGVAGAGPNYFRFGDGVVYAFHIDNNGDAKEDVTYAFTFNTKATNGSTFLFATKPLNNLSDANVRQYYSVYKITGKFKGKSQLTSKNLIATGEAATPVIGSKSQSNYEQLANQAILTNGSRRFFAGSRDDPFFVDLNVFDLLNLGAGFDSLKGTNVLSIVMEIPVSDVKKNDSVIGVWNANYRSAFRVLGDDGKESGKGNLVQVSRLGMPLVNEVVVPLAYKDYFNASHPSKDATTKAYSDVVLKPELAGLFKAVLGLNVPLDNRQDLVTVFLTGVPGLNQPQNVRASEMLRINTSTAQTAPGSENRLGVFGGDNAGFPNGRRLADDVTDIAVQAVAGKLVTGYDVPSTLGDGVNSNDKAFSTTFPYLASPHVKTK